VYKRKDRLPQVMVEMAGLLLFMFYIFQHICMCCPRVGYFVINPLTPELNPSEQRCLPKYFTGDLNIMTVRLHNNNIY
jgi:hypothetical protein